MLRALESLCGDGTVPRQEAGGERFYSVPEDRRMVLDYDKNSILHFFVPAAILSAALRSLHRQQAPLAEVMRRAKDASRPLKYESRPGTSLTPQTDLPPDFSPVSRSVRLT